MHNEEVHALVKLTSYSNQKSSQKSDSVAIYNETQVENNLPHKHDAEEKSVRHMNADSVNDVASQKAEHEIREPVYRSKKIVLGEIYVQLLLKFNLNRLHRAKAAED